LTDIVFPEIRSMVKNIGEMPDKNEIRSIEKKLEKCRNQDNNPDSEEYRIKMNRLLNDDDDAPGPMEYHLNSPDQDVSMLNASQFGS
jgi:cyclin H